MGQFIRHLLALAALIAASNVHAIPLSYGEATHDDPTWQDLSDGSDPFGVSWSVDGGNTWGRDELFTGQTVQFRFNMHKNEVGSHYADHLGAWIDWGQDGVFDDEDLMTYGEHILRDEQPWLGDTAPGINNVTFFSDDIHLTNYHVGETWLRARVTCSHSFTVAAGEYYSWDEQFEAHYIDNYEANFSPTEHYYQGESEDWKLTITEYIPPPLPPTSTVPVPGSIPLVALAAVAMASLRRKRS